MDFDRITEYLDSLLERGIPSFDCMIYEDHRVVYRHMAGCKDEKKTKKIQGDERYLMFSMTKVQTMTAFLQLLEQGKISLEDEVSKFLPAFANIKVETPDGVKDNTVPMKMKHLVSMQSGLDYNLDRPGIIRVKKEKGSSATTQELVASFVESPLKFQPGEHFCYSLSHDVVAAVIEVVSGMSYGEYLKKNIWNPLGMNNTFFAKPMNDDVPRLCKQFICKDNSIIEPMDSSCVYQLSESYESGGAGLISCIEDYAKFADTLACGGTSADGVTILKPETIDIMKTNMLSEAGRADIAQSMGRTAYGYGCGVQIFLDPELVNSPAPKGVFGWDGAAGSCITMDTVSKRSVVLTLHVRNCGYAYSEIHPQLRDFVFA